MTPDQVPDRLAALGEITCQSLFGGHGLYWNGTIFGIIFQDRLYLKVDDQSRGDCLQRGMSPFRPNERQTLKSYYGVPPDVITDDWKWSCKRDPPWSYKRDPPRSSK